jgi:glucosyl-3-phosphoglycerate synthase
VLPARDEEATVGPLVADVVERWVRRVPLVDEVVVVDSDSTDATAAVARAAGADVVATTDVLPAHGTRPGKGEALWKSLAATTGDLIVFLDADLLGDVAHYVPGLLGPLLADPQVAYVKGCYTRPLEVEGEVQPAGGGRVTELTARPLLNALWPEHAGFVQPLGGE